MTDRATDSDTTKPRPRGKELGSPAGSALVGKVGTFIAADLKEYPCVVTGTDTPPWDDLSLVITYVRDGRKIEGAMIPIESFSADDAI